MKEDGKIGCYYCQEKLDGTCLIFYSLNDNSGNSIEIIPKTRSQIIADEHILDMYKLVDSKAIDEFFKNPYHFDDSLMFELNGILNKHEIAHMETYIDLNLIGAYIDGKFLNYESISCHSDLNKFKRADVIYTIEKYNCENSFSIKWCGDDSRVKNYKIETNETFPTLYDAITEVKEMLKQINDNYKEYNGRRVIAGVVINGENFKQNQMYLKIKPSDIEAKAQRRDFIPRRFILKEVRKYFDEYGSKVRELYQADETHYITYVKQQLSEEFDYEQIEDPRTRKRINNVFMDVWDSKLPPMSIQNICEELIKANPDATVPDLMKIFANTYPSKKKQSRYVYSILSSIFKKN